MDVVILVFLIKMSWFDSYWSILDHGIQANTDQGVGYRKPGIRKIIVTYSNVKLSQSVIIVGFFRNIYNPYLNRNHV